VVEIILIIGGLVLLAGALAARPFLRRRSGQVSLPRSDPAAELRQELETRYRALAELDEDLAAAKLSTEDHSRLKAEMERAAAALLHRIDTLVTSEGAVEALSDASPGIDGAGKAGARTGASGAGSRTHYSDTLLERTRGTSPSSRERRERRPAAASPGGGRLLRRPVVLAGGAALFLLLGLGLGLLLARSSTAPSSPPLGAPAADRLAQLEQEVRANPTDLKKLLAFGHLALDQGQMSRAVWAYKQALVLEPNNVEAITHTGLLLFLSGHVDQALSHVDRALALDPTYAHALWDKANILYHAKQDYAGAIKAWEAFLKLIPSGKDADQARAMIAEAKGRALLRPTASPAEKPGAALRRPLAPALFRGKAAQAYQVAHEIPRVLERLTCYCGCDKTVGHRNLLDCFLDDHGST
jgi:cytochrome c-type biogenesis protein CcmH/NrfG